MGQYVAIDLHKRRSLIVRADEQGERLETVRIDNDPINLAQVVVAAGEDAEVVLEATCGWYWAADVSGRNGCEDPSGTSARPALGHEKGEERRADANALLDMLRLDIVPEAWIAPPPVRELRELVRYPAKLVMLRSGLKPQVQGVLTKEGVIYLRYELWGPKGAESSTDSTSPRAIAPELTRCAGSSSIYDTEIKYVGVEIAGWLDDDLGYQAVQAIKGVGPSSPLSSWPRSGTSSASVIRTSCARGRGSPQTP